MERLDPQKLHVINLCNDEAFCQGKPTRCYTLTHSDFTGDMFLTIGCAYDKKQVSGLYTRLMRDEVLSELVKTDTGWELRVHCHVSGGMVLGKAKWRNDIFHAELPLALEAIIYGDRALFTSDAGLGEASIKVHFHSPLSKYNRVEDWGTVPDYA